VEQSNRAWWLPATIAHPAFAAMLNADSRPRRPGLLVCRHTQPFPMNLVNRLRITKAAETIVAAARDLGVSISPSSPLLDARSESAWESIMRVLHQAAEIPVTPQQEIFSLLGRAGRARAYRNWRRAIAETGQVQQGNGRNLGGM
jgi:hypothetical protein